MNELVSLSKSNEKLQEEECSGLKNREWNLSNKDFVAAGEFITI